MIPALLAGGALTAATVKYLRNRKAKKAKITPAELPGNGSVYQAADHLGQRGRKIEEALEAAQ